MYHVVLTKKERMYGEATKFLIGRGGDPYEGFAIRAVVG